MRHRNSKLAPVLRAMTAYVAMQTAEPQPVSVPEPDEYGYWTRRANGGLHYHAYDPATEDDELADHLVDSGDIPDFAVGDSVRRRYDTRKTGVIVALIPAVEYPYYAAHPAKARVRWPDRTRIGGNGYSHSTIALSALVKDEAQP